MKTSPTQTRYHATPSPMPAQVASGLPAQVSPLQSMLRELRVRGPRPGLFRMMGANFESAVEALWANGTRSFLTALGIFIGVGAVVAALTLTQGVSAYVTNELASLGNAIIIFPGTSNRGGVSQTVASTLTTLDAQEIATLPHVTSASPFIITSDQTVYGRQNWSTQIEGVNSDLEVIQNWSVSQGSWFSSSDADTGASVAVLGDTVYHNLFDTSGDSPINKTIRIRNQLFRVVGVLAPQGGAISQDDVVFIPLKVAQIRLKNTTTVDQIEVQADTAGNVQPVAASITSLLRKNHRIQGDNDDFTAFTFTQILQNVNTSETILTALLVGIAAISLTVGGIGIMNIMLVSVTERTWEIGIRMAIGARRGDILNQFLIEAVLLCLVGGVIGLGLGLLIGWGVVKASQLPFVITTVTLVVPFAVASSIALLFGLYPAIRAARLDPIVAIRSEE